MTERAAAAAVRPIVILSAAAFASAATLRVADPLVPQLVAEFRVTPGSASIIATAFAASYGLCQIAVGALGDHFGKYRIVALATLLSALTVSAGAIAPDLSTLALARLCSGATAGAIIPLSVAYIGDVVPYDGRQAVLARFLSGQILGIIGGQVFGGLFGDTLGWRGIFVALGVVYLAIAALLLLELRSPRIDRRRAQAGGARGTATELLMLASSRTVQRVVGAAFVEAFFLFGGLVYLGAFLRQDFALSYLAVGEVLACFGLGGLVYAVTVKMLVGRLGERGLILCGGLILGTAFALVPLLPVVWTFAPVIAAIGTGFYMLHNTLQTHATRMAPHVMGLAFSSFALCYFLGQAVGVAVCGWGVDRFGFRPVFWAVAAGLVVLALLYRRTVPRR